MKKISLILSILMLLTALCGCHGKLASDNIATNNEATQDVSIDSSTDDNQEILDKPFVAPEEFDTTKKYNITFWAKNDTNVRQTAIYEQAIKEFSKLYPNINVKLRLYNDYGKIYNDVITNIPTATTPNVCITYPDHIATYLSGENTVVSLDELLTDPKYGLNGSEIKFDAPSKDEVVPEFLNECIVNGSYYGLPYMRSTEACYINKDYVEKLGYTIPDVLTWDYIWEVSEAAMAKDADGNFIVNGQKVLIPFIYKSTDNMMIQVLNQMGTGYSDSTGKISMFNNSTKEFLYTVYEHAANRAFSTFKISSYPGNWFNAGQCIFAIDSTAGATWIGADAPLIDIDENKLVKFETVIRAIPQFDTENPKMISQGPSMCIFYKDDPQEVLASWLFMQYLLTNDIQIAYSQTEGYVPVTLKAQESDVYKEYLANKGKDNDTYYQVKIDAAELLLNNTENTFVTPVFNGSTSLRNAAGQLIEEVAKAARRGTKIDDNYFKELYTTMISRYKLELNGFDDVEDTFDVTKSSLPTESITLLVTIAIIWLVLIGYFVISMIKKRKNTVD